MLRTAVVENGVLEGIPGADPRVTVFKGVPFAAPPVGALRWKAPQPCENWEGVRLAHEFGPIPMQDTPGLGDGLYDREWHVDPQIPMDEDCLYLNVWTPAKATDEKLPVLVWYFGGGYQWGYTAEMEFDGERLARRGIIVVSIAYRLGAFGFLAHSEITAESPERPGNFGLLDQQAGLKWVRRNIAAFGGDPDRITIAGQSAGGGSVMNQLTCEENYGDISGAVIISGIIRQPERKDDLFKPVDLKTMEEKGQRFFEFLGVKDLEEARKLDAFYIRDKYGEYTKNHPRLFPFVDGKVYKEEAVERFVAGKRANVPVISGNTGDEFKINGINTVERSVKSTFLDAQKSKPDSAPMYYYRFCPDVPGDTAGTFHSCDLWFFFESLGKCHRPFAGRHYELAAQMCDYFANFVKTGAPNGMGRDGEPLPEWLSYSEDGFNEMNFGSAGAELKKGSAVALKKQGFNPYLPSWEYVPDGEPYVFGDRVYVYGSHDLYDGETFCMGDYVCWSAPVNELANWRYEGVIYKKTQDPENRTGEMCLYAPDVTVGPDGKYYLYYCLDGRGLVSVAVCDKPAGRYEFLGYVHYPDGTRLGEKEGDIWQFDPGLLTEGDETFLYTGFCGQGDKTRPGAFVTVLGPDMLTVKEAPKVVAPGCEYSAGTGFEGHAFFEASSMRKKDGKYYFIYSSEVMHELCYAVSDNPRDGFKYGGVLVSNCDIGIANGKKAEDSVSYGANNHGSMVEINGKWYIFYHRHTNATWFSRQACAEELHFDADGKPIQAEMTSCGLNGGPLSCEGEYPAYIVCNIFNDKHEVYVSEQAPRVVQAGGEGQYPYAFIRKITDGFTVGFKYFDIKDVTGIRLNMRAYAHGAIEVRAAYDGEVLGTVPFDGSNIWKAGECRFEKPYPEGKQALYLTFKGKGNLSLKSFEFIRSAKI